MFGAYAAHHPRANCAHFSRRRSLHDPTRFHFTIGGTLIAHSALQPPPPRPCRMSCYLYVCVCFADWCRFHSPTRRRRRRRPWRPHPRSESTRPDETPASVKSTFQTGCECVCVCKAGAHHEYVSSLTFRLRCVTSSPP